MLACFGLTLAIASPARAIEVKKKIQGGGGGGGGGGDTAAAPSAKNPLTPQLQQQLSQIISDESDPLIAAESEKKSNGETYVDIEHAKFTYTPAMKEGKMTVKAKLEAGEYKGKKGDASGKGTPTGKKKALVFNYRLDGSKWTEVEQPKWEDVAAAEAKK